MNDNKRKNDTLVNDMLRRDDKGIGEARGILSVFFRIIMCNKEINPMRYASLMTKWLNAQQVHNTENRLEDRLSDRGNMNKDIYRPNMTWNSFLKALVFLRIKWFKITIEAAWKDSPEITHHTITIADPEAFIVRKERKRSRKKKQKNK